MTRAGLPTTTDRDGTVRCDHGACAHDGVVVDYHAWQDDNPVADPGLSCFFTGS
jgi:hypothetical protein